tara:strand:+ start:561 stop:920 length:360 start_codon:yes stop_codon:yes gene_type:complete
MREYEGKYLSKKKIYIGKIEEGIEKEEKRERGKEGKRKREKEERMWSKEVNEELYRMQEMGRVLDASELYMEGPVNDGMVMVWRMLEGEPIIRKEWEKKMTTLELLVVRKIEKYKEDEG